MPYSNKWFLEQLQDIGKYMLKDKLTLLISSCDKFSDLWDAYFKLLNKSWPDRRIDTILLTDCSTTRNFEGVTILSAGKGKELSERLLFALPWIKTEYILFTLDDYFPIYDINTSNIENLIYEIDSHNLDYVRLFKRPDSRIRINNTENLFWVDLNSTRDSNYLVNLYAGVWRKSFLSKTIKGPMNAWQYEVSLTRTARDLNARCAMSKGHEFEILDVVRKGKLLHKANKYLMKNNLYDGPRTVISWRTEFKINCMTFIKDHSPQCLIDLLKALMRKLGYKFFSDYIS